MGKPEAPWPPRLRIHHRRFDAAWTWRLKVHGLREYAEGFCWRPPTDVFATDDGGFVRIEVAGMAAGAFDVTFAPPRLVVAGVRRDPEAAAPRRECTMREIATGQFRVEVDIPWRVAEGSIEASYGDGFLTVRLPGRDPGDQAACGPAPVSGRED